MLHRPHPLQQNKHADILTQIIQALLVRETPLHIYKVRAHRGIAGNEAADAIAKQAATPGCHTVPFTSAPSLPSRHFWVQVPLPQWTGDVGYRLADNLNAAILTHATESRTISTLATSPLRTVQAVANLLKDPDTGAGIDTRTSTAFWRDPSISPGNRGHVLRVRTGSLWTLSRQHASNPTSTPSPLCPLCSLAPDTIGHRLNGCQAPAVKGLVLTRHGGVVHRIAQAFQQGSLGGGTIFCDAEGHTRYPSTPNGRRLPSWVLPVSLQSSRPDLVIIPSLSPPGPVPRRGPPPDHHPSQWSHADRASHTICIIEVGYSTDTRVHSKTREKLLQHALLARRLRAHGWHVDVRALAVGATGVLRRDAILCFEDIGITPEDAFSLLRSIHSHSIHHTCLILSYGDKARSSLLYPEHDPATTSRPSNPPDPH